MSIEQQVPELVESWLRAARAGESATQQRKDRQLARLLDDPAGLRFAMAFIDRVMRAPTREAAADQLSRLVRRRGTPSFLSPVDQTMLRAGAELAPRLPRIVLPLAMRRIRALTGHLVLGAEDPALRRHLERRGEAGTRTNLNRLGEAILGEEEAGRRMDRAVELLSRDDVGYVSVKISAVASGLNLWAFEHSLDRVSERLRRLYRTAQRKHPTAFVNLDMEEYRDLDLTIAAFERVLAEDEFAGLDAGIVLQAYLPDSFVRLKQLVEWAGHRHARTGGGIKVRIVKGANLAMERVEAEVHGWPQPPYPTKDEVDANWKRMIDWSLDRQRLSGTRIGVASHNLFDVAWAHLLALDRGLSDRVEFEMLEGMAPHQAAQVQRATGGLLLYTPIVGEDEFQSAIAYLFRRLEENSSPENFLRHLFDLAPGSSAFAEQRARFERTAAMRWEVAAAPRRTQNRSAEQPRSRPSGPFVNEPDSDPALAANRAWMSDALERWEPPVVPDLVTETPVVDALVRRANVAGQAWATTTAAERREVLERATASMARRRGEIIATMANEAGKVVAEGDLEVSEAIDFARFYARIASRLDRVDGARFEPLGTVLVTPPWNFPFAIAAGGAFAALAAGNAVIVKPPPETPMCVRLLTECLAEAGVPQDVVTYVRTPDDHVGRHLVTHPGVDAVVLTGAWETAELFRSWRPDLRLFAETSGKNSMVITSRADVDGAVADLVGSAFGHAGQKCSAASLAIVEAGMHDSEAFQRQLRDAVSSIVVGPATDPASDIGPLISPPGDSLRRALTELEPGERWLVEPEQVSEDARMWRPGVKLGVRPGSWFHHTECFGPVLGVLRAASLEEATGWQNAVSFGLTGGLWSLDPTQIDWWLAHVQVGNAYVNRRTTGAIVRRQPFGGWKRSAVGPGAKAGGRNYIGQFGTWSDGALPIEGHAPLPAVRHLLDRLAGELDDLAETWLLSSLQSDAWWWAREFSVDHDPSGLVSERNEFRYVPIRRVLLRMAEPAPRQVVARIVAAAGCAGVELVASVDPGLVDVDVFDRLDVAVTVESEQTLIGRLDAADPERVRAIGPVSDELRLAAGPRSIHIETAPPVASGRIELLRWYREQSISRTMHRYGNLISAEPAR